MNTSRNMPGAESEDKIPADEPVPNAPRQPMSARNRFIVLALIMAGACALVMTVVMVMLYRHDIQSHRAQLLVSAQSQARLIEAVARYDARMSGTRQENDTGLTPFDATLSQVIDSHEHYSGFGETGEFTLARREGESIVFVLRHRHGSVEYPEPVAFDSELAEPMRRALRGQSGTCIALDYRGETVLAAHEPVSELDLGIVAKIDLAEIRLPFIQAGFMAGIVSLLIVLIGAMLFLRISNPIIARLEAHTREMQKEIKERTQIAEALRESEERFRNLFENAPLGYQSLNEQGDFIELNETWCKTLGYAKEEVIGKNFSEFLHPDFREVFKLNFPRFKSMGYVLGVEFEMMKKDGSEITVAFDGRIGRRDDGSFKQTHCILSDITNRKKSEEERAKLQAQLVQAQKMESIGRLAGGVAHDFNNMLAVILGHAELALSQVNPAVPFHDDLKEIEKAAQRSAELTRHLLAFARKQNIVPKVLDLNDTVAGMLNMLRRLIGEDIDLAWMPGDDLWPVKVDPSQTSQVLTNLCINARDAIAEVGTVTIQTENVSVDESFCAAHPHFNPGVYVTLAVKDTGSGIDRGNLDKLFEPFFTTKEEGKGTGLGLAMVYGIVKQNGGFIDVESEPGKGTTVRIYLVPYAGEDVVEQTGASREVVAGGGETVLVVEDERALLELTKTMLENLGYRVLTAASPSEALSAAQTHPGGIRLLVTDVILPEMNGRELANRLQAHHPPLKVLFMSGYTADVISHHGVLEKGVSYLQKPFSYADLANMVRGILEPDGPPDRPGKPRSVEA